MIRTASLCIGVLLTTAVAAQEVPETAKQELWCALAFEFAVGELPADATGRQQLLIPRYAEGARMLLERAAAAYRRAGYSQEHFARSRDALADEIAAQLASDAEVPYSFEECRLLLDER